MEKNESNSAEWLTAYRENSIQAHKLRQANDHAGAMQLFDEALDFIEDEKQKDNIDDKLTWLETTLLYAKLDCQILLQETPSEVMKNLHRYGENLKQMMIDISEIHPKFKGIPGVFEDDFTATDIKQLVYAIERFDEIVGNVDKEDLSQEQLEKIAMFYFYLSNYFQTAQLFFGFSTMMIKEGEQCKEMFRATANRTIEIFDELDDEYLQTRDLKKYKDYVNKWYSIYADIMDATYALYVKDQVFESNWDFQEKDIKMLWKIVEGSLAEESDDEALNQMNQNAAAQAMELLMDVFSTEALMNIDNYERALGGLDKISEQTKNLKEPTKVIFYNHLKRAIIARKYLLDMRYNERLVLSQLNPVSFFNRKKQGSEDTAVAGTQYEDTDLADVEISRAGNFTFSERTTKAIDGLADRPSALSLPDEDELALISMVSDFISTNVYEQSEEKSRELRKNSKYIEWEKTFIEQLRKDLEFAHIYLPGGKGDINHISNKWLAILEARLYLYEYFHSIEEEDPKEKIMEVLDDHTPLAKLERIEAMLLKYAETPKGTYFRQIVEIFIILGWVNVEKNDFSKAKKYLCEAFNMLKDMGDDSQTLHNEIRRAYAKLKFLESPDSDLPTIDRDAKVYRKDRWNKAFCEVLKSGDPKAIVAEFKEKAREFVPQIVNIQVFSDNSGLPNGVFVKNDIARGGMYKTVIKVPQNSGKVLGIQSELPIPPEVLELLPEYAVYIFNLQELNDFRNKLPEVKDDKFKAALEKIILSKSNEIAQGLMSESEKAVNITMREKFYKKLVNSYNLGLHHMVNAEYADQLAVFSNFEDAVIRGLVGESMMTNMAGDPRAGQLDNILKISRKLTEFFMDKIGDDNDPEKEFKIKQFLLEQSDKDYSPGFMEFVQGALYPDDGINFLF